jgi:hypothetical protein
VVFILYLARIVFLEFNNFMARMPVVGFNFPLARILPMGFISFTAAAKTLWDSSCQ